MLRYINRTNKKGIFLIEVLVSVAIVGIVIGSILYSLQNVLKVFKVSNDFTKSIYLAEYVLFQENYEPDSVKQEGRFSPPNDDFVWELEREPVTKTKDVYRAHVTIKHRISKRVYAELSTLIKRWQVPSTP